MNILNFVKENVDAYSYRQLEDVLSIKTGVPYGTLMKIKAGQTLNPRINTIQPLLTYFSNKKNIRNDLR